MKYWKQKLGIDVQKSISPDVFMKNRNLRLFRSVRTFFVFFNPLVSLVLLSLLFTGVI